MMRSRASSQPALVVPRAAAPLDDSQDDGERAIRPRLLSAGASSVSAPAVAATGGSGSLGSGTPQRLLGVSVQKATLGRTNARLQMNLYFASPALGGDVIYRPITFVVSTVNPDTENAVTMAYELVAARLVAPRDTELLTALLTCALAPYLTAPHVFSAAALQPPTQAQLSPPPSLAASQPPRPAHSDGAARSLRVATPSRLSTAVPSNNNSAATSPVGSHSPADAASDDGGGGGGGGGGAQ